MKGLNGWQGLACITCLICITLVLVTGCLDNGPPQAGGNETETAIAIALADPGVQESIPYDTGLYEIVDAGPDYYEATGPDGTISWTGTVVKFRLINQSSIYRVYVDVPNGTVVRSYWQYIKDPMPCMQTGPPEEYASLEAAAAAPGPDCRLAAPYYVPDGYGFSRVQVFGDPCPRRHIYYTSRDDTLRLVQTASGDPPWAFAISMPRYTTVMVNGAEAKMVTGTGETQLAWTTEENISYWLWANLETEELQRIAQSVAPYDESSTPTPTPSTAPGDPVTPGMPSFTPG